MSVEQEQALDLSLRMQQAIAELQGLIQERYPEATFRITRSPEDTETVLLKPIIDIEDRDEVMDVVIDRLVTLQSEEQLSLLVVPLRPMARNAAIRQGLRDTAPAWRQQVPPLHP